MKSKSKKLIFTIVCLIVIALLIFLIWGKNNDTNNDIESYACEKGDSYKVAITISPGNVNIKNDIAIPSYKKITNVTVTNKSTCPQLVKISPTAPLVMKEERVRIEPNQALEIPLWIDIPPSFEVNDYEKYILFETITPNEDQKILLKNIYSFHTIKGTASDTISYEISKYRYYGIAILIATLLIAIVFFTISRKKSNNDKDKNIDLDNDGEIEK